MRIVNRVSPEFQRLEKAVHLRTRRTTPHRYLVEGSFGTLHVVDVSDPNSPKCDCSDYRFDLKAAGHCKHIVAALLRDNALPTREHLRELLVALKRTA